MYKKLSLKQRKKLANEFLKEVVRSFDDIKKNDDFNKLINIIAILLKNYKSE